METTLKHRFTVAPFIVFFGEIPKSILTVKKSAGIESLLVLSSITDSLTV